MSVKLLVKRIGNAPCGSATARSGRLAGGESERATKDQGPRQKGPTSVAGVMAERDAAQQDVIRRQRQVIERQQAQIAALRQALAQSVRRAREIEHREAAE